MECEVLYRIVVSFLEEHYHIETREGADMWVDDFRIGDTLKEDIVSAAIREALYAGGRRQGLAPLRELLCNLLDIYALRPFHIKRGVQGVLDSLPELVKKFPNAPDMLAGMVEDLLQRKKISRATVRAILEGAGNSCVTLGKRRARADSAYGSRVFLRILEKRIPNGNVTST